MGAQLPVACSLAPISRFHPPLKLTNAHCFMRTQLRNVQGAHTARASAVAKSARRTRAASP